MEQLQSFKTMFEAWYYKAGQIERESVVLVNFTKMARLDVRYTYRKTAVCLPLLRWAYLYVYIKAFLANNKFCKHLDENFITWLDCSWASWNISLIFNNCSKTLFTCRVGNLSNSWQEQQSRLGLFCTSTRRGVDQGHVWNQFHKVWFINIHQAPCIKNILRAFCPQSEVVTYCTLP